MNQFNSGRVQEFRNPAQLDGLLRERVQKACYDCFSFELTLFFGGNGVGSEFLTTGLLLILYHNFKNHWEQFFCYRNMDSDRTQRASSKRLLS